MSGVYISHRRTDADAHAERLRDALRARLGRDRVSTDADVVRAGQDFDAAIDQAIRGSDAVLVVIGRDWLNAGNRKRLDDPDDPIRREVALALRQNPRVIPVLLDGAWMPRPEELPDELKPLALRAAVKITDEHWEHDVRSLVHALSPRMEAAASSPSPPRMAKPGVRAMLKRGWDQMRSVWSRGEMAGAEPEPPPDTRAPAPAHAPRPAPAPPPPNAPVASPPEPVLLGASAPRAVRAGDEFTARFVAYVAAEEQAVRKTLAALSSRNESHLGLKTCQWQPGTEFTVRLVARGLQVSPAEQPFVWDGAKVLVEFDVEVPETVAPGAVVLKFDVVLNGITVAMLRLDLEIAAQKPDPGAAEEARASGGAARTAFASYSSKDRQRVLDRIDAVRIAAGLDIFLDCLSINPSEPWKQRLDKEIPARDLFMLFWSAEAAKSQWVEWEWRRALALKGLDAMQIHPLENGVAPPPELGSLHFGSVAMYARGAGG